MEPSQVERYARHLVLKEIGGPGQQALLSAKVCIVGAGGLGGPAGLYLAAAGIGEITLIDDDIVDPSNLQRQVQFVHMDIGMPKSTVMADTLTELNPDIKINAKNARLANDNAHSLITGHDIVLDGTDSFETRFVINAACRSAGIPLISGALGRFDGQVAGFGNDGIDPCYRCLVPQVPPNAETCSEVGVVGAMAGVVGSMMALETIKLITGAGESLCGKIWIFDGLTSEGRTITLPRDPACPECGDAAGQTN